MRSAVSEPIIVCPLAFEEQTLRKCKVPGRIICCGPGVAGMRRLGTLIGGEPSGPVILAGVAAAIDPAVQVGSAWLAGAVIGADGRRRQPNWPSGDRVEPERYAVIAWSEHVLADPETKRRFAAALASVENGARLVDQESAPFAELAIERRWTWGIARGVSDGLDDALPAGVETWVDEQGSTRFTRVLSAIATHPSQITALMSLRRNTLRALHALAALLKAQLA